LKHFSSRIENVWIVDGVRTPLVDYCAAFGALSPTDMGIKVARAVIARAGVAAGDIDSVITGSMAQADFDAYVLPRHIGLYAGVPLAVPAILVQRICGTGFELLRQAADQIALGYAELALVVGSGVSSQWSEWILFRNHVSFHQRDPQFHRDIGFYVFQLPFLSFVVGGLFFRQMKRGFADVL